MNATRANLEQLVEGVYPGDESAENRLKMVIMHVLMNRPDRDMIIKDARRWDMDEDKAARFMRGDVDAGFHWYSIEGTLRARGAKRPSVEMAKDLFEQITRGEQPAPPAAVEDNEAHRGVHEQLRDLDGSDLIAGVDGSDQAKPAPRPDPFTATTVTEFIALMCEYRVWKGKCSYREMSDNVGNRYSASTFSSIGTRTKLPSLKLVRAYIEGCGADPGDLEIWQEAWRRIALTESERADAGTIIDEQP